MDSTTHAQGDPFEVLGLPSGAGSDDVRKRYLELVKQFPPDHATERFREINAAYQAASDPLVIARRLLALTGPKITPQWDEVIEQQQSRPPMMSVDVLLSLGNRTRTASNEPAPQAE